MLLNRYLVIFLLSLTVLSCSTKKNEAVQQQLPIVKNSQAVVPPESSSILSNSTTVQKEVIGIFSGTNEDGDYWYFYIDGSDGNKIKFIYSSEAILKNKLKYTGKTLKVKYIEKSFEEAGSGKSSIEKYLESVEIQ